MYRIFSIKIGVFLVTSFLAQNLFANKKLTESYITVYKSIAISEMKRSGIPASIKLAQGILESDLGRSPLASAANNHFGIKCGGEWVGGTFYLKDDDTDSTGTIVESCFRSFSEAEQSYIAHSEFLTNPAKQARYGFLFQLGSTDYVGWANGLKFSGYATDPNYSKKLIKIIETNRLYEYDEVTNVQQQYVSNTSSVPVQKEKNKPKAQTTKETNQPSSNRPTTTTSSVVINASSTATNYKAKKINDIYAVYAHGGETIKSLAIKTKKNVYDLMEYNEGIESQDQVLIPQEIVFLAKKNKFYHDKEHAFHEVSDGESLYSISQKYGVRLESLMSRNNLDKTAMPLRGERISLNKNISKSETPKHKIVEQFESYIDLGSLK